MSATENETRSVMFVDDERLVLDALRRQFRSHRLEWSMSFVESGAEAIELLKESPADVVVTDMRMPQMNGVQLLKAVREMSPKTVRFMLSGQTDQSELLDNIGCIHQFLQKPCDTEELEHAIRRACDLSGRIESDRLREIVSGIHSLPIVSKTYERLVRALNDEGTDIGSISQIVEEDVGLSVKLLQLVNSAFFGNPRKTTTTRDAVMLIGTQNLIQLAMSAHIFDMLEQSSTAHASIANLWGISHNLGEFARGLAVQGGLTPDETDRVRFAGVLSHIGRAVMAWSMPYEFDDAMQAAERKGIPLREAEVEVFGVPQEDVGAYALGIWGFSDQIVESVARQATPSASSVQCREHPLLWLHLARSLQPTNRYTDPVAFDEAWAGSVGFQTQDLEKFRRAA